MPKYTAEQKIAYYKNLAYGKKEYAIKKKPRKANQSKTSYKRKKSNKYYSKYGAVAGGAIGAALGGPVGSVIGTGIGGLAGSALSSIMGHGAYKVNRNTIFHNTVPQFVSRMSDGSIRMKHKEFITDVVSSATPGAFKNETFKISASNASTFPYLSQIAVNFEEFMFEGLVFSYVPSSGSISTTGQLGTIIMATQYNSLSAPFTNKQQAEASTFAVSQVASSPVIHPIECDAKMTPSQGLFYTLRPSLNQANQDPRWQQLGIFNLMTQGMPAASENTGELWVSYDCVMTKPILLQDDSEEADHWTNDALGGVAVGLYFGNNPTLSALSDSFTLLTADEILIDKSIFGNIAISYGLHFTGGATGDDPLLTAGTGATPLNIIDGGVTNQYVKTNASTQTIWTTAYFTLNPIGVRSVITFSGGVFGTVDFMDLIIEQLPADFD